MKTFRIGVIGLGQRISHVLAAMGVPASLARCALRFSFGPGNTDLDSLFAALRKLLARKLALAG